jgi:hypothetical protein
MRLHHSSTFPIRLLFEFVNRPGVGIRHVNRHCRKIVVSPKLQDVHPINLLIFRAEKVLSWPESPCLLLIETLLLFRQTNPGCPLLTRAGWLRWPVRFYERNAEEGPDEQRK